MSSHGSQKRPLEDKTDRKELLEKKIKLEQEERLRGSLLKKKKKEQKEEEEAASKKHWERTYENTEDENKSKLNVFYCSYCGTFGLVLDCHIEQLPLRQTDGAFVIEDRKRTYKLKLNESGVKLVKRRDGVEKQYRWSCTGCNLLVAYQSEPFSSDRVHLRYIVKDSLCENPASAMELVDAA